eukprot:TRINITY_DN72105_c0_g1_i1.p1 TRINITY_DN72105_c0_g1~~TRINITY_DN72105_c0_g1_i1.p1  ORF type:complete len:315 (+),score=80.08 TRINITY_DN72105_c0_g1_i1:90-947(+)
MLVPCRACGEACSGACKGCNQCLCPQNSPSPVFSIFSALMNLLVLLFAGLGLAAGTDFPDNASEFDDKDKPAQWLGVACGIAVCNMMFACYLYYRFTHMTRGQGARGAAGAAWQLFAYDIGVFIYICFSIFVIVWLAIGGNFKGPEGSWPTGGKSYTGCKDQNEKIGTVQLILGLYLGFAGIIICCSVLTECGRTPRYMHQQHPQYVAAPQPGQQPYMQMQGSPPAQHPGAYPQQQPAPYPQQQAYPQQGYQQQGSPQQQTPQNQTAAQKAGAMLGAGIGKFMKK